MSEGEAPDGETPRSTINIPTADAEQELQQDRE